MFYLLITLLLLELALLGVMIYFYRVVVAELEKLIPPPGAANILIYSEELTMAYTIGVDDDPKLFKLKITDKHGNPAPVDGAPEWSTSDPSILTLSTASDGLTCNVAPTGALGTAQVVVQADADMGTGVKPITGSVDFTVVAGQAADIGIEPA